MTELESKPRPLSSGGLALTCFLVNRCTMEHKGPWKLKSQVAYCADGETEAWSRATPPGDTQT